jgi:hypothetical protein
VREVDAASDAFSQGLVTLSEDPPPTFARHGVDGRELVEVTPARLRKWISPTPGPAHQERDDNDDAAQNASERDSTNTRGLGHGVLGWWQEHEQTQGPPWTLTHSARDGD